MMPRSKIELRALGASRKTNAPLAAPCTWTEAGHSGSDGVKHQGLCFSSYRSALSCLEIHDGFVMGSPEAESILSTRFKGCKDISIGCWMLLAGLCPVCTTLGLQDLLSDTAQG